VNALDSSLNPQYLNYYDTGRWTYTVYDCQNIGWSTTLSINEVSTCKNPQGMTELQNGADLDGNTLFLGNLSVSVISPLYDQVYHGMH
jgi:hypothetical protein